jgi:DNA-binding transcriptional MerR regulator
MVAVLRFIEDAQSLGFSLREIGDTLPAMNSPEAAEAILPALENKLADVEAHIRASKRLRGRLLKLIEEQNACVIVDRQCALRD